MAKISDVCARRNGAVSGRKQVAVGYLRRSTDRQESKDLSKVTIRGLLTKSATGTWMGGVPPYGYDLKYESFSGEFLMHVRYMRDGSKQIFNEKGRSNSTSIQCICSSSEASLLINI